MARDPTARDCNTETSLLKRRKYLKLAGAAVTSVAATSASKRVTAATTSTDYETITVGAGETFTESSPEFDLQDGGTWENKLIDITADGAGIFLNLKHMHDWTIRNVGVKGVNESGEAAFRIADGDSNGKLLLENVYLADGMGYSGSGDGGGADNGGSGIFVHPDHAGHLTINRINVQHFANNGIYASSPGKDNTFDGTGGSGGSVIIKNSFSANNDVSCFRLAEGNGESRFENCVAVSSDSARGFWAENGDVYAVNCDSSGINQQYCVGSSNSRATLHVDNCRADEDDPIATWDVCTSGTFDGTFGSNPRTSPPKGVPTSAEAAAAGKGGSDGGSGGGSSSDEGTVLELVTDDGAPELSYEFTVEGSVQKRTSAGDNSAEGNDSVTDNGDGTVTVSGVAGNGYGDSYLVDGTFLSMNLDESQWTIRYGGEQVSVGDLTGPTVDRFEVSKSNTLGEKRMFSVKWAVSADSEDLDTVEVSVVEGTDVNFSVTEVGGASASNWDLFQFPVDTSVDVNLRVENASGTATKKTKTVEL